MNKVVSLGGGLEMLVVNRIDFGSDYSAMEIIKEGVELQRRVFEEQGVSFPDKRVLKFEDSVGSEERRGALDGSSPTYHHLYLLHQGGLVGMRVTEELDVKGFGRVILDYLPPLVPLAEAGKIYLAMAQALMKKADLSSLATSLIRKKKKIFTPVKAAEVLSMFTRHLTQPISSFAATFSDGIGVGAEDLRQNGYLRSEAGIWVPPMDAKTIEEYVAVLPEAVHMVAKFSPEIEPRLERRVAEWLFVQKNLKEGYIDRRQLRRLGLSINELPCIVRTRESLQQVATANAGYVPFAPIR